MGKSFIAGPLGLETADPPLTFADLKAKMITTLRFMGVLSSNIQNLKVHEIMVPDWRTGEMECAIEAEVHAAGANDALLAFGLKLNNKLNAMKHASTMNREQASA